MTPDDYRALATRLALRQAIVPEMLSIWCATGCGAVIKRRSRMPEERFQDPPRTALVEDALGAGWQVDAAGNVACAACAKRLLEKEGHGG